MYLDSVLTLLTLMYVGFTLVSVLRAGVFRKNRLAAFAIFLFSTIIYCIVMYGILLINKAF